MAQRMQGLRSKYSHTLIMDKTGINSAPFRQTQDHVHELRSAIDR
jgi:hypothetical protein